MLPIPSQGIGALQLPSLPPTASGPHPSGPGTFNRMFDEMSTAVEQRQGMGQVSQLPTSMEVRPIMPSASLDQAWAASVEFPDAVGPDGLKLPGAPKTRPITSLTGKPAESPLSFLEPLRGAVEDANRLQHTASDLAAEAAVGGDVDLHDVMISGEKAGVALNLTLQIRNRLVDAYQEVMRMQV
jgi:flagellar hook-basal body complex protein FliE